MSDMSDDPAIAVLASERAVAALASALIARGVTPRVLQPPSQGAPVQESLLPPNFRTAADGVLVGGAGIALIESGNKLVDAITAVLVVYGVADIVKNGRDLFNIILKNRAIRRGSSSAAIDNLLHTQDTATDRWLRDRRVPTARQLTRKTHNTRKVSTERLQELCLEATQSYGRAVEALRVAKGLIELTPWDAHDLAMEGALTPIQQMGLGEIGH